jgi:hypothetical protein
MFECVPATPGVPLKRPVAVLKVAQLGAFWMEKLMLLPSGSRAVGVNAYATPAVALVEGEPEIVGARLGAAVTTIENARNAAEVRPSLALMIRFEYVPISVVAGVPLNTPVAVLKVAQRGRLLIR